MKNTGNYFGAVYQRLILFLISSAIYIYNYIRNLWIIKAIL